ncbi:MAG TPA: hypothetical protein VGL72_22110, partial [Bryobacteraceae bacterium]
MQKFIGLRSLSGVLSLLFLITAGRSFGQTATGGAITVSGTAGVSAGSASNSVTVSQTVTDISLTLTSLHVTNLNSVAIVLVAPGGQALDVVSGVCGAGSQQTGSSTFTLDDTGDTGTSNFHGFLSGLGAGTCPSTYSGTYFPVDYAPGADTFNSPGPSSYKSAGVAATCTANNVSCGNDNFSTVF